MTESRPGGQLRPFGTDELADVAGIRPDELAAESRLARDLEGVAVRGTVRQSADFTDRVMAAVAKEPSAAPVRAAGLALRSGAVGAFLGSIRDAVRVTVSPSFPLAMRAQAMGLVLMGAGLAAGGGVVTAGALGLIDADRPSPSPSVTVPSPSVVATPERTVAPTEAPETAEPSGSLEPSTSPEEPSAEPSDSPDPVPSSEDGGASATTPAPTHEATRKPTPAPTHRPTPSPSPSPSPSPTPSPTPTDEGYRGGDPSHPPGHSH